MTWRVGNLQGVISKGNVDKHPPPQPEGSHRTSVLLLLWKRESMHHIHLDQSLSQELDYLAGSSL